MSSGTLRLVIEYGLALPLPFYTDMGLTEAVVPQDWETGMQCTAIRWEYAVLVMQLLLCLMFSSMVARQTECLRQHLIVSNFTSFQYFLLEDSAVSLS